MKPKIYLLALAAALIALLAPQAVLADTVFTATGSFSDLSTLSGTITINTTTGAVTASDLTWSDVPFVFTTVWSMSTTLGGNTAIQLRDGPVGGDSMTLVVPVPTLTNYTGGSLCGISNCLFLYEGSVYSDDSYGDELAVPSDIFQDLDFGTLAPTPTPEPGGLLLLSTGLLGLVGVTRRKRLA